VPRERTPRAAEERLRARASSFGSAAGPYERGRPPYPADAIDWLLPPGARRVLDLGAGMRSNVITLPEPDRLAVLAAHPALAGADEVIIPYITECFRADLP
jgi:hypothetical protein